MRTHYLARLVLGDGLLVAEDFIRPRDDDPLPVYAGPGNAGDLVEVRVDGGHARPATPEGPLTAQAGSAVARMYEIAAAHRMDPIFGPEVDREVEGIIANPGFDDPELEDLRDLAFITIDNPDSRDLDQAMYIESTASGFRVVYALADASYYMDPGSALFHEALRRGATYYFPGFSVPMLPRALSEDLVSLNPQVDRRAFVFDMQLGAEGEVQRTRMYRGLIHSRAKLSYRGVQTLHDHWDAATASPHALEGHDYTDTLRQLRVVGELRMQLAFERDVVRYRRRELHVGAGPTGCRFTVVEADRNDVERWNEQISLLCNSEGARAMVEAGAQPNLQAVFRVHDPPHHRRVRDLASAIDALVDARQLDASIWRWSREHESLAQFLDRLPDAGEEGRLSKAIQRLALVINNRSEFSDEAGAHHGVGASAYARFSSPMRELVGVFTHKEAIELLTGAASEPAPPGDIELQTRIIELANESKARQAQVTKEANRVAISAVLAPQLERPASARPWLAATLIGVAPRRAYVQLDDVPIELKVYFTDLAQLGTSARMLDDEVSVALDDGLTLVLGDAIEVKLLAEKGERFVLDLRPVGR